MCPKCRAAKTQREWWERQTPERRRAMIAARDARERDRRRNEEPRRKMMHRARTAVSNAIRDGRMQRGECEVGGDCRGPVQAHHDDYSRPLDVRWLCKGHHDQHHREGIAA